VEPSRRPTGNTVISIDEETAMPAVFEGDAGTVKRRLHDQHVAPRASRRVTRQGRTPAGLAPPPTQPTDTAVSNATVTITEGRPPTTTTNVAVKGDVAERGRRDVAVTCGARRGLNRRLGRRRHDITDDDTPLRCVTGGAT